MRAARVTHTHGPNAIAVDEVPEPVAGMEDVLIEVKAAGVNFPDLLLTEGKYQYKPEPPFTLGGELSGVVLEAPASSGFLPGDRVAASTTVGAFAELVSTTAANVYPLPDNIGFAAAAALPMNYLTVSFALSTRGGLQRGETVLVHGAAGGIGTATIQLASALGARVISVVSTQEEADFVTSIGSHETVLVEGNRGRGFKEAVEEITDGRGVDIVLDPVGGPRFTDSLRCLAPLGRLLVVGFTDGQIPSVKVNRLLLNNIDVRGVGWGSYATPRPGHGRQEWNKLIPHLVSGVLSPPIGGTFPLEKASEAVAQLGQRRALGKLIITPATEQPCRL